LPAPESSTIADHLELDLARVMGTAEAYLLNSGVTEQEHDHRLRVFAVIFSRSAFERATPGAPTFHDNARYEAGLYEECVPKSLSDQVFARLCPTPGKAVAMTVPADAPLDGIRRAMLILLYRLLFILCAEDRSLLPVKDRRFDDYALRGARLDVGRRKDEGAHSP
jgi:hypothetical protein